MADQGEVTHVEAGIIASVAGLISAMEGRLTGQIAAIKSDVEHLDGKVCGIKSDLLGEDGDRENSVILQLDRLKERAKRQEKWMWIIATAAAGALFMGVKQWIMGH